MLAVSLLAFIGTSISSFKNNRTMANSAHSHPRELDGVERKYNVCIDMTISGLCGKWGAGCDTNAGTEDKIRISFYDGDYFLDYFLLKEWQNECESFDFTSLGRATSVKLEIFGDDRLIIDRLKLSVSYRYNFWPYLWSPSSKIHGWGANNGDAWCLSTDPNDAKIGEYKSHVDSCEECLMFREKGNDYKCSNTTQTYSA